MLPEVGVRAGFQRRLASCVEMGECGQHPPKTVERVRCVDDLGQVGEPRDPLTKCGVADDQGLGQRASTAEVEPGSGRGGRRHGFALHMLRRQPRVPPSRPTAPARPSARADDHGDVRREPAPHGEPMHDGRTLEGDDGFAVASRGRCRPGRVDHALPSEQVELAAADRSRPEVVTRADAQPRPGPHALTDLIARQAGGHGLLGAERARQIGIRPGSSAHASTLHRGAPPGSTAERGLWTTVRGVGRAEGSAEVRRAGLDDGRTR